MADDSLPMSDPQHQPKEKAWEVWAITAFVLSLVAAVFSIIAMVVAVGATGDSGNAQPAQGPSAISAPATSPSAPASATGSTLAIDAREFYFSPTCFTNVPTGTVTLKVHNTGGALHNVSIPSQGIDQDVAPGKTIKVKVNAGPAAFQYFCKYHKAAGMVGALVPAQ